MTLMHVHFKLPKFMLKSKLPSVFSKIIQHCSSVFVLIIRPMSTSAADKFILGETGNDVSSW
jgi:hypothetical protein